MNTQNMNKGLLIGIVAVVLLAGGFFALNRYLHNEKQSDMPFADGYRDIAYTINGKVIDLEDGTVDVDGVSYAIVGEETEGDITEDGISDIAFLLEETKATSTNLFLLAAVRTNEGYRGTSGAPLGDITPLELSSQMGGVVLKFARKNTADVAASSTAASSSPSLELHRFFVVIDGELQSIPMPEL